MLYQLTDFYIHGDSHKYISINTIDVKWISKPDGYSVVFEKCSSKKVIKYVMDNCFFEFGSKVFQQVTEKPMGSDTVLFMANLLFFCITRTNVYE